MSLTTGAYRQDGSAWTLTNAQEYSSLIQIDAESDIRVVTFTTDGEYLVSGNKGTVCVWRVKDGQQMAVLEAECLWCLAVSTDGKWISVGTWGGETIVWHTATYQKIFVNKDTGAIRGVDFSPDSTRLAASGTGRVTIWDIANHKQVQTLRHPSGVVAVKYSPQGDHIATATDKVVRIWDSKNGHRIVEIKTEVTPDCNTGLLWTYNHFLVISGSTIKEFNPYTGSIVSEWPVPDSNGLSSIALPKHRGFIAYSENRTVTFWHTSTHSQLGLVHYPGDIHSIAVSPDDQFLAIGGEGGKITIQDLSPITDSFPLSHLHPTFQEPDLRIDDAALDLWKHDRLGIVEALFTTAIAASQSQNYHLLANRSLVRARLEKWDAALVDAERAIDVQPSVIGYIAKSVAHVGNGEKHAAYRMCDIAFERFHSSHVTFLLLVKAVIVFMAGEHHDAISRLDDLMATVRHNSICYIVQGYMYFLLGNEHMECGEYPNAIQLFQHACAKIRHHTSRSLLVVSLISGWKFDDLHMMARRRLCEALYEAGRMMDAVECFLQMTDKLGEERNWHEDHLEWDLDFRQRSSKKLEGLGDAAADSQRHDEAISHYTIMLSLSPPSPQDIFVKRGKAFMATGSWIDALDDADQAIELDPSSPWGYEIKHAVLHKEGDYKNAVDALEVMHSMIEQSPDPHIQRCRGRYKTPSKIRARIHRIVQQTLRDSPHVLINTTTGRLYHRDERKSLFESLPIFHELVSSMTTRIDRARIKHEVQHYFRYVMLSHKWEENEPLFHQVIHTTVYDLDQSPTHHKLKMFCKIAQKAEFIWAWSDTCCINTAKHDVHQEALVAMFRWYRGSAMMIVFLRGVSTSSQRGALIKSIWNTRSWTLQEYIAARVIRLYTEDWTLYLNLDIPNHKEAPEVISEMEQATSVSSQQLMALRPGLTSVREKLRLASIRETTRVEDAAYSLLGIFTITGISVIYGEAEAPLGRLLAHVLTGSGDVSILAWTGESSSFNSCLPAYIIVFKGPATSHVPLPIPDTEMQKIITEPLFSFNLDAALALYDRLNELDAPWFVANRMKLPCIAFQLPRLMPYRSRSGRLYRVDTPAFGTVEIRTRQDLSSMKYLYLIHPWLDTILEREGVHSGVPIDAAPPPSLSTNDEEFSDDENEDDSPSVLEPELPLHPAPSHTTLPMDRETRARRLVAYLQQPFGALLVTLAPGHRSVDYRRVAADGLITVQFQKGISLKDILDNVRILDIL